MKCGKCQTELSDEAKFCLECGHGLPHAASVPPLRYQQPHCYKPKHLVDEILTNRSAIEVKRKLVTVMFADVAGFNSISEKLDPEDVHHKEAALFLFAEYDGVEGVYCLAMPVTDDMAMAGGREVFGFPKKMADINFDNQGDFVEGWAERHGVRYFQVKAELKGQPNDASLMEFLQGATSRNLTQGLYCYNFKYFRNPEGTGFDYNPRLMLEAVTFKSAEIKIGKAEVVMNPSDHDPWAEVEVVKMLGAFYTRGDNTMQPGKIVAEVDPVEFAPYAFLRWDRFFGKG